MPAAAFAVPQQPIVQVFVRQRVGGVGQSPGVVHEAAPASQTRDEVASAAAESLAAESRAAESTSASWPASVWASPSEPSLVAESTSASGPTLASASDPTLASASPGEPSLAAESTSASDSTLASESSVEPSSLDAPPPLLDPELLPELEPDPPLLLEGNIDASFPPVSSPPKPLVLEELPQLAAMKTAAPIATTLASSFGVGKARSGMAHNGALSMAQSILDRKRASRTLPGEARAAPGVRLCDAQQVPASAQDVPVPVQEERLTAQRPAPAASLVRASPQRLAPMSSLVFASAQRLAPRASLVRASAQRPAPTSPLVFASPQRLAPRASLVRASAQRPAPPSSQVAASETPYLALGGAACLGRGPHGCRPTLASG